jgi:hypothetical protein
MTALLVLEGVALALLALLVVGLLRSHAEILRRLHDLGVGLDPSAPATSVGNEPAAADVDDAAAPHAFDDAAAPRAFDDAAAPRAFDIVGVTPAGTAAAIGVPGAAHDTLLAFLSSGCLTCAVFWKEFADVTRLGLPGRTRVLAVTKGPDGESPSAVARVAPPDLTVVMSSQAWEDYAVPGSPYFLLVDGRRGRVVGEATGDSWTDVRARLGFRGELAGPRARRPRFDPDAANHVDAALLAAGIGPGHPSLYATPAAAPATSDAEAEA